MKKPMTDMLKKSGRTIRTAILLLMAAVCLAAAPRFMSASISAQEVTEIVTAIPNLETTPPQETQAVTEAVTTLPYDTPQTDEQSNNGTLLDYLDITDSNGTLDLILLITLLSLAPSIIILMTCFTRIIIVFSLLRNAMGTNTVPPNQVLVGLAIFLTLFIMTPVIDEINETAYTPYKNGEITVTEALDRSADPLKGFMLRQTSNESMAFFLDLAGTDYPETDAEAMELGLEVIVPAYVISEIKTAFSIGFLLFLPFLIIDIVVSATLMSLGMIMLPPAMISLPFKILMFVLVDGWMLLCGALVNGFA